jgi:pimeloyl-ACP methyl ester carboxylesterase
MSAVAAPPPTALDRSVKHRNTAGMPTVGVNGIEVFYERFGDAGDPALLMVCGLGMQSVGFEDELVSQLVALGLQVIRYDNRDVGLSSWIDGAVDDIGAAVMTAFMGGEVDAPYTLSDMAADGIALLDVLDIGSAHILGASMGGMIVQTMAIEHPDRVRSMTSVMSTTGEPEYGTPDPECLSALVSIMAPAETRAERVESGVELQRIIGTVGGWDERRVQDRVELLVDRAYNPAGVARQLLAILASGHRGEQLPQVTVPTMVLHGDADRLVDLSGGRRTAELVPGAELRVMEGMGHDLPPGYWGRAVQAVADVVDVAG